MDWYERLQQKEIYEKQKNCTHEYFNFNEKNQIECAACGKRLRE